MAAIETKRPVAGAPERAENAADATQIEALMLARDYLYTLFHKLTGGVPTGELMDVLESRATAEVVGAYAEESEALAAFGRFLAGLGEPARDRDTLLDAAKDEFTRVFFGPGALPASPYESPYRQSHDEALFQENTLAVRHTYHMRGFRLRREQAVPDDHVSALCCFMSVCGGRALVALRTGDFAATAEELRFEEAFSRKHLQGWLSDYARFVRDSDAGSRGVFYPQALEALAAFVEADLTFLVEAAFWLERTSAFALAPQPELTEIEEALSGLRALRLVGLQDTELMTMPKE